MNIKCLLINKLGVDKAIFFTLLGRGLQISTALFTVFFIAKYLSPDEQGYFFTFGSIVAIQVFFELGLTQIITQFVAHEASHLKWDDNYKLLGEDIYISRLSSLLRFCVKWYLVFAVLLLIVLLIVGIFFFSKYHVSQETIAWKLPWLLLVIGTGLNLLLSPIIAFIGGLGKVKEVAEIRLVQQFIYPFVVWGGLIIGSKLFVAGADAIIRVLVVYIIIVKSSFFTILKNIWYANGEAKVSYKKEIFPYQWRIALSWISGYFIFQLFNPVLFATEGPQIAGQMGMTMAALNGIQTLAMSWISTKIPYFSGLIATGEYVELDGLFNKTMKQMMAIGTILLLLFIVVIYVMQRFNVIFFGMDIGNRFLPVIPLSLMTWSIFTMLPINCWATYLRCHKKEPLFINSVVISILCCMSTLILGDLYGVYGICIGFAFLRLISLTWIYSIFKKKRNEWHEK